MTVYSPTTFPDSVLCWPIWEPSFPSNGATQSTTGFRAEETAPLMIELSRWPMQRCCFGPMTGWDVGIPTTWDLSRHTWPQDNWGSGTGRTPLLGGRLLDAGGLLPAFRGLAAAAILEARNWGLSRTTLVLKGLWVLRGALGGRLYIVPNRTVHGACGGGFDWSWFEGWLQIHGARLALVHSEAVPRAVSGGLVRCRIMAWLQIDRAAGQRLVLVSNRAVLSGCERGLVWHRLGPRLGIHGALGWHLALVRNGTVLAVEGLSEVGSCLDWISIGLWGSGWLLLLTELFSGMVMEDLSDTGWGLDWGSVELWVGTLPLFVMEQSPGLAAEGLPIAGSGLDCRTIGLLDKSSLLSVMGHPSRLAPEGSTEVGSGTRWCSTGPAVDNLSLSPELFRVLGLVSAAGTCCGSGSQSSKGDGPSDSMMASYFVTYSSISSCRGVPGGEKTGSSAPRMVRSAYLRASGMAPYIFAWASITRKRRLSSVLQAEQSASGPSRLRTHSLRPRQPFASPGLNNTETQCFPVRMCAWSLSMLSYHPLQSRQWYEARAIGRWQAMWCVFMIRSSEMKRHRVVFVLSALCCPEHLADRWCKGRKVVWVSELSPHTIISHKWVKAWTSCYSQKLSFEVFRLWYHNIWLERVMM